VQWHALQPPLPAVFARHMVPGCFTVSPVAARAVIDVPVPCCFKQEQPAPSAVVKELGVVGGRQGSSEEGSKKGEAQRKEEGGTQAARRQQFRRRRHERSRQRRFASSRQPPSAAPKAITVPSQSSRERHERRRQASEGARDAAQQKPGLRSGANSARRSGVAVPMKASAYM